MPGDPSHMQLSVVVLTYKNGKVLGPWVQQLHQSLSSLEQPWEIVLVANVWEGETDEAKGVAQSLEKSLPHVRVVSLPKKGGYGWDVKSGLETSRGEVLGYIDGDGQIPPDTILPAFKKMAGEKLDLVKAYRVQREDGLFRRAISWCFNLGFRILFAAGFKDINAKPKLFTRDAFQKLDLQSDDWFIDAEIMMKAGELNLATGEFPIAFHSLTGRASLVGWQTVWEFCKNFAAYRIKKKKRLPALNPQSLKG